MAEEQKLVGKTAIITGAAQGQGAAEARLFARHGANVVLTDVNPAGASVAAEIGDKAIFVSHDVTSEAAWQDVVAKALEQFGKLDILVNNAGIFKPATLEDTTVEQFEAHYRVNQLGVFLGGKSVIAAMRANGGGAIVNISSGAGLRGYPGIFAYTASKWAVTGMTKSMAAELAADLIRVNSIHPGLVETPMIADHSPEALVAFKEATPLKRIARADEIADLVLYLASDSAGYITGATVPIDGGIGL